jgi:hypothetical protein
MTTPPPLMTAPPPLPLSAPSTKWKRNLFAFALLGAIAFFLLALLIATNETANELFQSVKKVLPR